jgi:ribosomal protein L31
MTFRGIEIKCPKATCVEASSLNDVPALNRYAVGPKACLPHASQSSTKVDSTENTPHMDTFSPRWQGTLRICRQGHRISKLQRRWEGKFPRVARRRRLN